MKVININSKMAIHRAIVKPTHQGLKTNIVKAPKESKVMTLTIINPNIILSFSVLGTYLQVNMFFSSYIND